MWEFIAKSMALSKCRERLISGLLFKACVYHRAQWVFDIIMFQIMINEYIMNQFTLNIFTPTIKLVHEVHYNLGYI